MAGATLLLVGCSSPHPEGSEDASLFDELIEKQIELAEQGGASDEQLYQLETARTSGEVTDAQVRQAAEATRLCLIDLGAQVSEVTERPSLGRTLHNFTFTPPAGTDEDAFLRLYDACEVEHREFLRSVYEQQHSSVDALWAAVEEHQTALRQCLVDMGGTGIDDLDTQELWSAAKDQSFGGADRGYSQQVGCVMDVGIGW